MSIEIIKRLKFDGQRIEIWNLSTDCKQLLLIIKIWNSRNTFVIEALGNANETKAWTKV